MAIEQSGNSESASRRPPPEPKRADPPAPKEKTEQVDRRAEAKEEAKNESRSNDLAVA